MRMRLEGLMGSKAKFSQRIDVPGTADTPENLQGGVLLVFPPGFGPTLSPGLDASAQALERQKLSRPRGRITARQVDRGSNARDSLVRKKLRVFRSSLGRSAGRPIGRWIDGC